MLNRHRPVAVVNARIEVARHGDVEDDHRCAFAPRHGSPRQHAVETAARHDRLGRAGGAQDNISLDERVVQLVPRHGLSATAGRHLGGLLRAAVGHEDAPRLQRSQVPQRQLPPSLPAPITRMVLSPKWSNTCRT